MKNPRHILITGASGGIGSALALAYAAPGVTLSLQGRDRERLAAIAAQAAQRGANMDCHIGDVADAVGMKTWIEARHRATPLDLLIANAGISGGTSRGPEDADQAAHIFAVNVVGVLNSIQPALPLMRAQGRGQIALMSSLAAFRGFAGAPAYCASKAAVRVYGEALRAEMAPHRIEINVICPGFIKTPMTDVNSFPMPMLMPANRAADIIRDGLARNKARIAFPLPMYLLVRAIAALPQPLIDFISAYLPKK